MRFPVLTGALLLSVVAHADVVETKSGDHLSGKIKAIAGGKVLLDTDYAGTIGISIAQITNVTSDSEITADTTTEQRISGRLQGLNIVTTTAPVAIADIAVAAVDAATLDAGKGWKSRADAGVNVSSGNSDTKAYNLRAEAALAKKDSRHLLTAAFNRAENGGSKTRDDKSAGYEYNWLFSKNWYFAANTSYFADDLKDVKYRLTVGAGVGYLFYDNPTGRFSVDLGASGVFEDLNNGSEQNPALRWGLNFNQFLIPEKLEFFHKHSILALADSKRGQIFDSSTGLRMRLSDHLDAGVSVDLRHETKPAPGRDKTDTIFVLGAGYRF